MTRQLPQQFTRSAGRARTALVAVTAACLVALFVTAGSRAANPSSGTVTTANAPGSPLVFTGGPYTQPNPSNFVSLVCQPPAAPCDDFTLNVDVPDGLQDAKQVRIMMKWGDPNADFDFRVYRRNPDGTAGEEVRSIGSSSMPEVGLLPAVKGSYVVRIIPFNPLGQSVRMEVTVEPKVGNFTQGFGTSPRYHNYPATNGLGTGAAEPTLGVNWRTGKVMFIAGLETLRVTFNDSTRPAAATWEDKSYLLTSLETLDPILYTDRDTGRTIISQLAGTNSLSALTDDDGETWVPNEGGPLTSGVDHQTVGGGPFAPPLTGGVPGVYPNAVYYCSQDAVTAFCARSDDGGLTYGPTVPMFLLTCGGIHGHVQVGPDGTVYVPNRACGASQGVLVSTDNGITWNVRYVADADDTTSTHDSVPGSWDPAIGVGSGGTVYFGYDHADGTPHVTVSRNKGATWTDDQNVGIPFGIRSTAFPTVIAGDDDRAAFAFLGSPKAKTDTTAQWHLYVSTTYDGGKSWHTVDATPNDPVQIGPICDEGFGVGACPNGDRNLLDFMDIQVDKEGRVLVGYADGCVGCTSAGGSRSELGTIARQTCGRRLFKQYDAAADDCAAGPTPTPTPAPTPTPDGSGCAYPGRKVVSDNSGDQTGAPNANQSQDIEWIRVTEDYSRATPMLAFTVKVAQLPEITPNASWTMLFSATHADNTSTTYFFSADSSTLDNPVGLSYNYGFVDVTNQNLNTSVGPADEGSMDDVAKTITIKVAMSKLRKPVAGAAGATLTGAQVDFSAGKRLSAVNGRTSLLVGALGTGLIQTIDSTGASEYEINGQPACTGGPTPTPTATPTATPTPTPAPTVTPTPTNDPRCAGAGPEAVSDPANDQTGAPNANQSQDVRSVSISERYNAAGAGQLVFTMKVSDLTATLTPNASWRVSFNAAHADNTVTTYFVTVANNSNANPTGVSYNYGFVDTSRNNLNSTVGTADGGSMSADADTLTVTLSMDKLRKPVAGTAGQTLTGAQVPLGAGRQLGAVAGATSVLVGGLGNGLNVNVDSTSNGSYTVAGAATCPFTGPTPTPVPTPGQAAADAARFHTFTAPPGVAEDAGEPSIGVNWKSERFFSNSAGAIGNGGTVTYYGGFLPYMLRVTFDDSVSPAAAAWDQANLTLVNAPRVYGDPILFTDPKTGRTFVSQELGLTPLGSTMEFTDDDGRTFLPSTGSGAPSGIDHQTVGGGPYHAPVPTGASPLYPHGVWYCSQSVADAVCSISLDGGATFGPAVPMYTLATCGGLHGHIKIGPDGTAYIPNRGCFGTPSTLVHSDGKQSLIVSEDNGITWAIRPLPQSSWGERDPSVAVGRDNTVYFAYQNGDGRSRVAVSRDKGVTWESDTDVGALAGVKNSAFHAAVAGDGDRAAVAYYGTTTGGSDWNLPGFAGVWYLYVSTTYDRGKTWTTVNVTPGDPVQRGGICGEGQCRNLLDFFGAELDKRGRVLVGYDDGCIGACVAGGPNSFTAKAAIARQSGGKPMYAEFDPPAAAKPAAPAVAGSRSGSTVTLSWAAPDHGGSAITGYKVYRRDAGGVTQLATVASAGYADTAYAAGAVYRVTAVSAAGEGPYKEYNPAGGGAAASACDGAGLLVVSDVNNDGADLDTQQNTPPDPRVNVKSLSIGEPFTGAGANKLVFTLKVGASTSGNTAPPSSQWFITWNSRNPTADFDRMYVAMLSDAQGNVRFEYGRFGAATPLDGSSVPSPNTNQPSKLGDAAGNYDAANGTITITLPTSQAENVAAGQTMNGLNVRTFFARPEAGVRNQATASDITGDGSYTLVGNASCSGAPAGQSAANDAPASRAGLALAVLRQVLRV